MYPLIGRHIYENSGFKIFEIKYPPDAKITELGDISSLKATINLLLIKEPYLEKSIYITRFNTPEDKCEYTLGFESLEYKGFLDAGLIEKIETKGIEINGVNFKQEIWEEDRGNNLIYYYENYKTYSKKLYFCYNHLIFLL